MMAAEQREREAPPAHAAATARLMVRSVSSGVAAANHGSAYAVVRNGSGSVGPVVAQSGGAKEVSHKEGVSLYLSSNNG